MRGLAVVTFLAGAWLVIAPYILGYRGSAATNDLILGAVILIISGSILSLPRERAAVGHEEMRGLLSPGSNGMFEMVKILAEMPEEQRRSVLRERLRMFALMLEGERKRAMRTMLEALLRLPDDELAPVVLTRTRLLSELPERTRRALLQTHVAVLNEFPDADREREWRFVMRAVSRLPAEKRLFFERMIQSM